MRSRYFDRRAGIGADVFTSQPAPTCPPGQHWEAPAISAISACVPDVVTVRPLTFHKPAPAPAAPPPVVTMQPTPTTATAPAPTAAPATPTASCPAPWPLWWLLVAAAAGAGAGYYAERNRKKVRRNAGRIAGRIVNRAGDAAIARVLG